jgi:hypothetical protein
MPPDHDRTEAASRVHVQRMIKWFAARGLRVTDVPYDGDCALHAVAPAFASWLGRPTTADEIRALLVSAWRAGPQFQGELQRELAGELGTGVWPAGTTTDDVLAHLTGLPVLVWAMGDCTEGPCEPYHLYADPQDRPAWLTLLYVDPLRHMCRVALHRNADFTSIS